MKSYARILFEAYYKDRTKQKERSICIRCGKFRVLGVRNPVKGICKKCRKSETKI
jgi:hypothetical protein